MTKTPPTDDEWPTTCPGCNGEPDNGFDRCYPPNPYFCTKCDEPMHEIASPKDGVERWNDEQRALDEDAQWLTEAIECLQTWVDEKYSRVKTGLLPSRTYIAIDELKRIKSRLSLTHNNSGLAAENAALRKRVEAGMDVARQYQELMTKHTDLLLNNTIIPDEKYKAHSDALRVAKEALEAGVYALAYVEDNGKGDGITLAAEGLMREAITKLNAAMGG